MINGRWKGKTAAVLFAAAACVSVFGQFKALPKEQKISHPDLLFCVTFDQYSTRADKAGGNCDSKTMADTSFLLRGAVGFDGQQAYQPNPGEKLPPGRRVQTGKRGVCPAPLYAGYTICEVSAL